MIYLILTPLASTLILILFKIFVDHKVDILKAISINYLTATLLGIIQETGFTALAATPSKSWFWLSLAFGVLLIAGFNLFGQSTRRAGMTITAMAGRLSLVIPVSLGLIFFGEAVYSLKIAGIALALLSFYLILRKEEKGRSPMRLMIYPILLFLVGGSGDSLMKTAQYFYLAGDTAHFLTFAFSISFILSIFQVLFQKKPGKGFTDWQTIAGGILLGILNWYSTLFMLRGIGTFDISMFLPVVNVSIVALSALAGTFLFHEKLSRINLAGLVLAVLAIVFLAR